MFLTKVIIGGIFFLVLCIAAVVGSLVYKLIRRILEV